MTNVRHSYLYIHTNYDFAATLFSLDSPSALAANRALASSILDLGRSLLLPSGCWSNPFALAVHSPRRRL